MLTNVNEGNFRTSIMYPGGHLDGEMTERKLALL